MFPVKRVWVYHGVVDLRKSYLSLQMVVEQELGKDAFSGDAFLFVNRNKTLAKGLWWDRTGWCLFIKKLSTGRFRVSGREDLRELSNLQRFLDGL